MKIRHAMETPDGQWRVEVVQRGSQVRYRLIHGKEIREPIAIGTIVYELTEAGVDMADLIEVEAATWTQKTRPDRPGPVLQRNGGLA